MVRYTSAEQLLRPGEVGLFIFTEGMHLTMKPDGTGSTGIWVIDPRRRFDWVVIYKRNPNDRSKNELFMARCGDFEGPKRGRYSINLHDIKRMGLTDVNWKEFASASENPIRYISRD